MELNTAPFADTHTRARAHTYLFHVVQRDRLAEQLLVEEHGEAAVDVVAVVDGHAEDATDKVEVGEVVGVDVRVAVDLQRVDVLAGVLRRIVKARLLALWRVRVIIFPIFLPPKRSSDSARASSRAQHS